MVESICARCCECSAVPRILIASSYIVCGVVVLTDVEVQGVCAVASIIVCIVVGVSTALVVDDIMPCILFAGILVIGVVSAAIDYEV